MDADKHRLLIALKNHFEMNSFSLVTRDGMDAAFVGIHLSSSVVHSTFWS